MKPTKSDNSKQLNMELYNAVAVKIVSDHEDVMGPAAKKLALSVGLEIIGKKALFLKDPDVVLEGLVEVFNKFFGNASLETIRQIFKNLRFPSDKIPKSLAY